MNEEIKIEYLKKFNKRSQYLGNLIHLVNGLFLTVFLAFFTLTINSHFDFRVLIICISILVFWRGYIHFIDSEIIQIYRRIVYCELYIQGGIDREISLQESLSKQKSMSHSNRGQLYFDIFALVIMVILSLEYFYPLLKNHFRMEHNSFFLLIVVLEIFLYSCYFIIRTINDYKEIDDIIAMKKIDY
jgi:hypothetical protein